MGRGGRRAATTLSYCTSLPRCPEISCSLLLPDYLCALCRLCCWDSPSVHCGHCCQCALMSALAKELNFLFFLFSVKRFKQNLWLVLPCWALGFPQHCPSLCAETAGERTVCLFAWQGCNGNILLVNLWLCSHPGSCTSKGPVDALLIHIPTLRNICYPHSHK